MRKTLRCIKYIFTDCYQAFPAFFIINYIVDLAGILAAVAAPVLLAHILELAGAERGESGTALAGAICLYGVCLVCTPVTEVLFRTFSKGADVLGKRYFGTTLVAFSERIRLEALENPETLDKFHRANAGENRQLAFFEQVNLTLKSAVTSIAMVAVVGRYSPVLVLTGLIPLFPEVLTKIYFEKKLTSLRREQSNVLRRCDYLRGLFSDREAVKEMRVMGFEGHVTDRWKRANAEKVDRFRRTNLDIQKKQVWGIIVINCCFVFNIGMAFYLMVQGNISPGAFAACLSAFTAYDSNMQTFIAMFFNAVATYHIVEDYYDYFTIPTQEDGSREYQPFQEAICAQNLFFRYSGSREDALRGFSCRIEKGEHVVIVGENGSGKTTFSKLLTGAYLPSAGHVAYDGQRTEDLRRKSLYTHISVVLQDFVHYQFSLRENVGISDLGRMGDTESMEELVRRVAGEEFLEKTGGLDIQLGREFGGEELSGGEWQKIAIARGLWKDSDIIILDEPTSALDPLVEYDILSKFVDMIQNRTSVIISHRVGICRTADKIIVMKEGRMAECGRHEELLQKGGEYAKIWREQARWYV